MEIPPIYKKTQAMLDMIAQIEEKRIILSNIPVSSSLINNLQRQSLLKSSLFSAKIEGNSLSLNDLDSLGNLPPDLRERLEIENVISAFNFVRENPSKILSLDYILDLHKIVMKGLVPDVGVTRKEPSAIFNQSGFPVYIPPPPSEINNLLGKLLNYVNSEDTDAGAENILIKAALAHIIFEKIHPFLDGNGRVGRLLYQILLSKGDYHFNWLLSLEEEINNKKEEYYVYLDKNDATSFIEFSLEIVLTSANKTLEKLSNKQIEEETLLPRRQEILNLIKDHKLMSLDSLRRRFLMVSPRMIRYDLKQLEKNGFIIKIGSTRGAMYKIK
jgi:Fic family protein